MDSATTTASSSASPRKSASSTSSQMKKTNRIEVSYLSFCYIMTIAALVWFLYGLYDGHTRPVSQMTFSSVLMHAIRTAFSFAISVIACYGLIFSGVYMFFFVQRLITSTKKGSSMSSEPIGIPMFLLLGAQRSETFLAIWGGPFYLAYLIFILIAFGLVFDKYVLLGTLI
eukprot:GEZU01026496.1.p1 GENE.GEZU01026496.1~~GEZU01026496.1.p1  ORF type:complete len:171 (-),score=32.69 GEZU01026496.1:3-515(-)